MDEKRDPGVLNTDILNPCLYSQYAKVIFEIDSPALVDHTKTCPVSLSMQHAELSSIVETIHRVVASKINISSQ